MKRVLLSGLLLLLGAAPATFAQGAKDVIINELLVKNRNNYQDDYGHRVSWIELRNAGHSKIDLASCYLVLETSGKNFSYRIPKGDTRTTLAPGGYVVFFCEGSETKGTFHTNFTLTGETSDPATAQPVGDFIIPRRQWPRYNRQSHLQSGRPKGRYLNRTYFGRRWQSGCCFHSIDQHYAQCYQRHQSANA